MPSKLAFACCFALANALAQLPKHTPITVASATKADVAGDEPQRPKLPSSVPSATEPQLPKVAPPSVEQNPGSFLGSCAKAQLEQRFVPVDPARCIEANLMYVRLPKTGSTSLSSVMRRIGARYGLNGIDTKSPKNLAEPLLSSTHYPRPELEGILGPLNLKLPKFYITMLRDPVERRLSHFYYEASKGAHRHAATIGVLQWLQETEKDYYYNYLRTSDNQTLGSALESYALVGVTERFEESVVLLMELLGLSSCDALYMDGKVSGTAAFKDGKTFMPHIPMEEQTEEVKSYVSSKQFQDIIATDLTMYKHANRHMDAMIASIGKQKFQTKLRELQSWRKQANSYCKDSFVVQDNDLEAWQKDNCYLNDFGCGYQCFDKFCKYAEQGYQ